MGKYRMRMVDENGREAQPEFNAVDDIEACLVADKIAASSTASWTGIQALEDLAVDDGTYTNYNDGAKPVAGSTVRSQGKLHYGVQTRQQELKVTIPAVVESLLSSASPTIGTDPIAGVGKLIDEEGVVTTSFNRGKFDWGKRKGD